MSSDLAADLRARLRSSAFHTWFGVEIVEAARGAVTVELEARPEHLNLQGLIHGGLLATLADVAMGLAVRTDVGPGRRHVTIDLSVRFLRAGRPGRLEARGRTLRVGRQVAFAEADVLDGSGRVLVAAQGTYSVTAER